MISLKTEWFLYIYIPITQGCFVLSLVLKMIFKVCQYIFTISLLSLLEKGHGPSFEQT